MKKLLITGGTVFVSKYAASYFVKKGYEVFVLNRNTREQVNGVQLICADRNHLGDALKGYEFDFILDICAYDRADIANLIQALDKVRDYIFISSSAVYPETNPQPFTEEQRTGENSIWKKYSTDKADAEKELLSRVPNAYIIRPPYIYGPMQNIYREPFVFECALKHRRFYIPKDGKMKLQFFYIEDLCKIIESIMEKKPKEHIYNVGNEEIIDINTFVELCYKVVGELLQKVYVNTTINQKEYFSFYDYEYVLDVSRQKVLLPQTKGLEEGLKESYHWYIQHQEDVMRKNYMEFIDRTLNK